MRRGLGLSALLLLICCIAPVAQGRDIDATTIQQRLAEIEKTIPLPYHPSLQNDIKSYASKQLPVSYTEYESVIKEELLQLELPEEILYLPMALSNMRLDYHRDRRAGIWALPELVAIRYGLTVDETHDERFSVEASTHAALCYLKDLYEVHDDWWQGILAYANSPAAINNAHLRHPEADPDDPWNYYDKSSLPDVRVIGDFIACYYVYSSDDKSVTHSSEQYTYCDFDHPLALPVLASTLGMTEKAIRSLNPIFLTEEFMPFNGHPLRLPTAKAQTFESQKENVYNQTERLKEEKTEKARIAAEEKAKERAKAASKPDYITYTVKRGDTLGGIAKKHHVTIKDLKKWNKLKGDMIRENQKLKIYP